MRNADDQTRESKMSKVETQNLVNWNRKMAEMYREMGHDHRAEHHDNEADEYQGYLDYAGEAAMARHDR